MTKLIYKTILLSLALLIGTSANSQEVMLGDRVTIGGVGFQQVNDTPAGSENWAIFGTLGQGVTYEMENQGDMQYIGFWHGSHWATTSVEETQTDAQKINLSNYPNPFNVATQISFELEASSNVSIKIYDVNGNLVQNLFNGYLSQGTNEIKWNGKYQGGMDAESGTYLYEVTVDPLGGSLSTGKIQARNIMVLVK